VEDGQSNRRLARLRRVNTDLCASGAWERMASAALRPDSGQARYRSNGGKAWGSLGGGERGGMWCDGQETRSCLLASYLFNRKGDIRRKDPRSQGIVPHSEEARAPRIRHDTDPAAGRDSLPALEYK
jgi:hypothetical protein